MTTPKTYDDDDGLLKKNPQKLNFSDSNNVSDMSQELRNIKRVEVEDEELRAPALGEMSILQYICIAILYIIFALLVSFIIYISATWNKDRTNEYT